MAELPDANELDGSLHQQVGFCGQPSGATISPHLFPPHGGMSEDSPL